MIDLLRHVMTTDVVGARVDSLARLLVRSRELSARFAAPIDRAIAGGLAADRVGFAFAAGYQAALDALVPGGDGEVRAFCATEEGGAHPRAITTRVDAAPGGGHVVRGRKRWATFAPVADVLLVVASTGTGADGKNRLRVVRVGVARQGVAIHAMPETPFAPEIPHAEVTFDDVRVDESDLLAGDGYDRYVKPFRTVEDVHVLGALLGYVCGVARANAWPHAILEDALFQLAAVRGLGLADPSARETHIALGGAFRGVRALLARAEPEWSSVDEETRARWVRDRGLLDVAETARTKRLEAAWRAREID